MLVSVVFAVRVKYIQIFKSLHEKNDWKIFCKHVYYMFEHYFGYFDLNKKTQLKLIVSVHTFFLVITRRLKIMCKAPVIFLLESSDADV